jgi:hypothetical protein
MENCTMGTGIYERTYYVSRSFLKDHGEELGLSENAAGIIIYFIERDKNEMLIWFRKNLMNISTGPEIRRKNRCIFSKRRRKQMVSQELLSGFLQKISKDIPKDGIPEISALYRLLGI